jgi:hypothetical protein
LLPDRRRGWVGFGRAVELVQAASFAVQTLFLFLLGSVQTGGLLSLGGLQFLLLVPLLAGEGVQIGGQ